MATTQTFDADMFGEPQARDDRFDVRERWKDLVNYADGTPEYLREFFHRQMNEEVNVMENAAQSLADFPDEDWEIRMWLARQCADEARHTQAYLRVMAERGIRIGEYPVMNFQYRMLRTIDSLIGRLAVENRTFEAEGLDAVTHALERARSSGDADVHVGFANDWIRRQIKADPRNMLKMSAALTRAAKAFELVFAGGGSDVTKYPVAEAERRLAGFDEREVRIAAEMSAKRRNAILERKAEERAPRA
jgi:uncharacterized ferritin-like protein (DUF455 family)